jgi:ribosome maturation factor RimP
MTDQPVHERVRQVVEPSLAAEGFELIDVERHGSVLRVTVDLLVEARDTVDLLVEARDTVDLPAEPGELPRSIDLEGITAATRIVSDLIDANDLIGDRTTLEVSSPGIERTLRTPAHFRRFLGTEVAVKTRPGTEGERRLDGVLEAVDDDGVVVAGRALAYGDIERARTVFVWPSGAKRTQAKKIGKAS